MTALTEAQIGELSEYLESAELDRHAVSKVTDKYPSMTMADAYEIQWAIRRRKIARGARIVGMKMGLTSRAKMQQMGVASAIYGFLADYFACPDNHAIRMDELIHPKVEVEIGFFIGKPLRGPGCHLGTVMSATDFVVPAVEVIDSRYENFRFDLISVVADNASSSRFVVGGMCARPADLDLASLGVVLQKNAEIVEVGAGAAVLGHPAASVAMLANMLAERGEHIPADTFVMTGGITSAVAVTAGDNVFARIQSLGAVSMRFV
jgi:2-oxo-3-hexenedioate decarboxylase